MPFFQNPFAREFQGYWVLGDRHHSPTFKVLPNAGRGPKHVVSWNEPPYDMSGNDADSNSADTLVMRYALRGEPRWATLSIDVTATAVSAAAVTSEEIVAALNANATFADRFEARLETFDSGKRRVAIISKADETQLRFYIVNGRAEEKLNFNARAGVSELPTYFSKHTVDNLIGGTVGSEGMVIELDDSGSTVDANIIDNAVDHAGNSLGYDSSSPQEDWQLLQGRSGIFQFTKGPSGNAVNSTETVIIYPAGAKVGDLATKIITQLDSSSAIIAKFEMPYTLTSSDLVTPP